MPSDEAVAARVGSLQPEATRLPPDFIVDLLTASSQIDAGLAERAVDQLLGHPKCYDMDDVLVPAACVLARLAESLSWPAATRLGAACLRHLRQRVALPLAPPQDWTRPNSLGCTCAGCQDLGKFLLTPDQKQWRLKAVQDRRGHVEQTVRRARCDLDLVTERRGGPHSLVATKNQASYERRVRQRREDLAHIATLTDNPSA